MGGRGAGLDTVEVDGKEEEEEEEVEEEPRTHCEDCCTLTAPVSLHGHPRRNL